MNFADNLPQLVAGYIRELLALAVQMFVDFHGGFLHHAVGISRASGQQKVWTAGDPLLTVLCVKCQA